MASVEFENLLNALGTQSDDARPTDDLVIDGYLLRGQTGSIRIVTGELALAFDIDDVLAITEVELPPDVSPALAVPVNLVLKRGARLLDCSPAAEYLPLLERPIEPFAYAVRTTFPPMQHAPRFRTLEDAFRELHDLK